MKRPLSVGIVDVIAAMAIVAAVAAFVMPTLVTATTDANQSNEITCATHLKEIGLAMAEYEQDNDACYPPGANWYGSGSGWAEQIYPYLRSTTVYKCPSDRNPGDSVSYGYNSNLVRLTSYIPSAPRGVPVAAEVAPNVTVAFYETANNCAPGMPIYTVDPKATGRPSDIHLTGNRHAPVDGWSPGGRGTGAYPGELVGLGDANPAGSPVLQYATGPMSGSTQGSPLFTAAGRHQGYSNFLFADTHVAALRGWNVSAGKTNPVHGSCGGDGIAANTGCVDGTAVKATFSVE